MPPLEEKQSVVSDERPTALGDQANSVLQKYPWLEWLIPVALCAAMLGQLPLSVRQVSQTADEATHLYSGYRYLKCGDLTVSPEHPPLAGKIYLHAPWFSTPLNFLIRNTTAMLAPPGTSVSADSRGCLSGGVHPRQY